MSDSTRLLSVHPELPEDLYVLKAARILKEGGLVVFPTETVYGLGANGLDADAAKRIFAAKGRPSDNPLILHISDFAQVDELAVDISDTARKLMRRFWPGPLTLVLKKATIVPDAVTGGQDTVALRMPDHAVALALIRAAGMPLAAPSANLSGKPSPTTAEHVLEDLRGRVAMVLDAGPTRIGMESTVIDVSGDSIRILRPGGVGVDELRELIPDLQPFEVSDSKRSPGTRYRHYSPNAQLKLVHETEEGARECLEDLRNGKKVAWIGSEAPAACTHVLFPKDAAFYARYFFAALRDLDEQKFETVYVEAIDEIGLGVMVMDRVKRAAAYDNSAN